MFQKSAAVGEQRGVSGAQEDRQEATWRKARSPELEGWEGPG